MAELIHDPKKCGCITRAKDNKGKVNKIITKYHKQFYYSLIFNDYSKSLNSFC